MARFFFLILGLSLFPSLCFAETVSIDLGMTQGIRTAVRVFINGKMDAETPGGDSSNATMWLGATGNPEWAALYQNRFQVNADDEVELEIVATSYYQVKVEGNGLEKMVFNRWIGSPRSNVNTCPGIESETTGERKLRFHIDLSNLDGLDHVFCYARFVDLPQPTVAAQ